MSSQNIENFKDLKFELEYQDILEEYANKCCEILKQTSPRNSYTKQRQHGKYADTWVVNKQKGNCVVWNEKNWQLTHLLENGHLIVNKSGGVGWASPHPHIAKAFEQVKSQFEQAMEQTKLKEQ